MAVRSKISKLCAEPDYTTINEMSVKISSGTQLVLNKMAVGERGRGKIV